MQVFRIFEFLYQSNVYLCICVGCTVQLVPNIKHIKCVSPLLRLASIGGIDAFSTFSRHAGAAIDVPGG